MSDRRERIAAIHVGSNTVLLTVAEYDPETGLVVIEEGEDQPRLGAGLSTTGQLSEEAILRALRTLTTMGDVGRRHRVQRCGKPETVPSSWHECARWTSRSESSLPKPKRLSPIGPPPHFPGGERQLVADIGGGSLELIGATNGRVTASRSPLPR